MFRAFHPLNRVLAVAIIALVWACVGVSAWAQPPERLAARNVAILEKVVAYDQNRASPGGDLRAVIIYDANVDASVDEMRLYRDAFRNHAKRGEILTHAFTDSGSLQAVVERATPDLLFMTDGNEKLARATSQVARRLRVLSTTSHARWVETHVSVAVVADDHSRRILVNLESSKAEGRALSSDLLALASVIR